MNYALLIAFALGAPLAAGEWQALPKLPDAEGFAGSFAGVSNGALIVAGGANFPDKKPWEGGKKVWTDAIFVLEKPTGEWKKVGRLPRALGYGVSVTHGDKVICIGGSDATEHYKQVFALTWESNQIKCRDLPALPKPVANGCGVVVGNVVYVIGGQEKHDSSIALRTVWALDLSHAKPAWVNLGDAPGPGRIFGQVASFNQHCWLIGGIELVPQKGAMPKREYLKDVYELIPGQGWQRRADLPRALGAAPGLCPSDANGFYLFGGDDGTQVGLTPDKHRGFRSEILKYTGKTDRWEAVGEVKAPRVTVPLVEWEKSWVIPSGERLPGVRSPEVWRYWWEK